MGIRFGQEDGRNSGSIPVAAAIGRDREAFDPNRR